MADYKSFNNATRMAVYEKGRGLCWYCGCPLERESRGTSAQRGGYVIDHLLPRSAGGTDHPHNLVPSCWSCNSMKGASTLEEYRERLTRLENNAPKFTTEQLFYLRRVGIELPVLEQHVFFFETR